MPMSRVRVLDDAGSFRLRMGILLGEAGQKRRRRSCLIEIRTLTYKTIGAAVISEEIAVCKQKRLRVKLGPIRLEASIAPGYVSFHVVQ
jgi:hypothetical protein